MTYNFTRPILAIVLLAGLLILAYRVVQPFLASLAWALILCYVTWPLHARLRKMLGERHNLAALISTALLATALVLPLAWLVLLLEGELVDLYQALLQQLSSGPIVLPEHIRQLPVVGGELQRLVALIGDTPEELRAQITQLVGSWRSEITGIIGGVGKNLVKLGFALLTAFFVYRDGEALLVQVRTGIRLLAGKKYESDYLLAAGTTTRAVVFGIVLTAVAQGALAGIGYWIFNAPGPIFLAAVTTLVALIPFGTPFAWGGVALWMIANGNLFDGIGLLLWGIFLVSWIDNILRPLVISSATKIPFIIVIFGVLGGLAAFGMVGLFIGPVILAVMLAVWREWLADRTAAVTGTGTVPERDL